MNVPLDNIPAPKEHNARTRMGPTSVPMYNARLDKNWVLTAGANVSAVTMLKKNRQEIWEESSRLMSFKETRVGKN